jgi:hypothetical protein
VGDQGFDFQKPVERREAKQFEPPPWEAERFEEFARERAQREAQAAPAEPTASEELVSAIAESAKGQETAPEAGQELAPAADAAPAAQQAAPVQEAAQTAAAPVINEAHLDAMLVRLASEEPKTDKQVAAVKYGVGLFVGAVGAVVLIWGVAGMTKASAVASQAGAPATAKSAIWAGAILTVFGVGLVSAAGWLVVRTLRERGVL